MANLPALEWRDLTLQQVRRTVESPDAVRVHDLRVAIRRFNQLIAAVDDSAGNSPRVRQRLKKIMTLAGGVRDLDIAIKLIGRLEPSKTLSRDLSRTAHESRNRAGHSASRMDRQPGGCLRGRASPPRNSRQARRGRFCCARPNACSIAASGQKNAKPRPPDCTGCGSPRKSSAIPLELVNPAYPRLDRIKRLQSMLGDINDCETASVIVKRIAGPASKKLRQRLRQKQAAKIRNFRVYWKTEFSSPAAVRRWMLDMSKLSR